MSIRNPELTFSQSYYWENRLAVRAAKRAKVERLLSGLTPFTASLTFAIDPFSGYELAPTPIAKTNRDTPGRVNALNRKHEYGEVTVSELLDIGAVPGSPLVSTYTKSSLTSGSAYALPQQSSYTTRRKDTTKRTRPAFCDRGEFESWKTTLNSKGRSNYWLSSRFENYVSRLGVPCYLKQHTYSYSRATGAGARASQTTIDQWKSALAGHSVAMLSKHGQAMLTDARANSRSFDGLREFAELKDLPRMLHDAVKSVRDLQKSGGLDLDNLFLSESFGWKPLVSSVLDLVALPGVIAKRLNFLLSRADKLTTFRSKRTGIAGLSSPSGFAYEALNGELNGTTESSATIKWETRCAVNFLVRFPKVELPLLKEQLNRELWGLRFRPIDFYDLVPWSWLADWFTGLGDYVALCSSVTEDESLVNWSTLAYSGELEVKTVRKYDLQQKTVIRSGSDVWVDETIYLPRSHTSIATTQYNVRRDTADSVDLLKMTWDLDELSEFQAGILGALFSQRTKKP